MKRVLLIILFGLVALIPASVFAAATELTQAMFDSASNSTTPISLNGTNYTIVNGEYILGENIDLGADHIQFGAGNNVVIDTNGKTITSSYSDGTIIINGAATIEIKGAGSILNTGSNKNSLVQRGGQGTTTIDGPTFNKVYVGEEPPVPITTLIINSGTFEYLNCTGIDLTINDISIPAAASSDNGIFLHDGTFVINDGTVASSNGLALDYYPDDINSSLIINGGTFNGHVAGLIFRTHSPNSPSLTINDGTFTGGQFGIYVVIDQPNLTINKGEFNGTSQAGIGFINTDMDVESILGERSKYESDPEFVVKNNMLVSKKNVEVIRETPETPANDTTETTEEKKEETKNPKTGDFIHIYISMLMLSSLGLLTIRKRLN